VLVQQCRDRVGVNQDAGDVGRGGEAPDPQRPVDVSHELGGEVREVEVPVRVGNDVDHVGVGLPPRQFVGMVLVRADEHYRPLLGRDLVQQPVLPGRAVGQPQFQDADEFVDRGGGAGATEDDHVLVGAADGVVDDTPRVFAQQAGGQAGAGGFRVGVGVPGQHMVPDGVLDEVQRPTGSGVVGVGDPARPVRAVEDLAFADDPCPDPLDQRRTDPGLRSRLRPHVTTP